MLFFERNGKIVTLNQLDIDSNLAMQFLRLGTNDLNKIIKLCSKYNMRVPTELKMEYNVMTKKYKADYKYTEVCNAQTGISAGEVFINWLNETKNN